MPVSQSVLETLAVQLPDMTPELRKAAAYVLDNPQDVGVSSIREIAEAARVKPNTFVRMARPWASTGYEDFREPFREEIRRARRTFPTAPAGCSRCPRGQARRALCRHGRFGPAQYRGDLCRDRRRAH
jgi:DNA-binding MurR/RpiR family transcriptional regulator